VRAFDARTGKLVWTFHTVAQRGEYGNDTWAGESWLKRGGVNAWPPLSVDLDRGIVFLPLTSPSADYYGGDRAGKGLFGDSLVALEAATGKRLWHFQTVHHNLWDYDLPAQPTLVQVRKNGKLVDAVVQVTKTGFTFVFDRATGEPVFPIEEFSAAKSEIPGEAAWPTQPIAGSSSKARSSRPSLRPSGSSPRCCSPAPMAAPIGVAPLSIPRLTRST
jgi:quinoprotein glucose dehydrogenase